MSFTSTNTHLPNRLRLQFKTIPLTLFIFALLTRFNQYSAADYDAKGGNLASNSNDGGGGSLISDIASNNDDIYETAALQQDMNEHAKRQKLLEEEEKEDSAAATKSLPNRIAVNKESIITDATLTMMDDIDFNVPQNSVTANVPIALPSAALATQMLMTMIPAYVRKGKAEQFPRTIIGGSVSVEEVDANVSNSDYVEDEEKQLQGEQQNIDKIDANAIKLDPYASNTMENTENNKLKDPQFTTPSNQQPPSVPQPRMQQLHPNSSEDDYYEDIRMHTLEIQNLRQHNFGNKPTVAPALIPPHSSLETVAVVEVSDHVPTQVTNVGAAHVGADNASSPSTPPQVLGGVWTTSRSILPVTSIPAPATGQYLINDLPPIITTGTLAGFTTELIAATAAPTLTPPTIIRTTHRSAGKQGKQINIPRGRKLLPHEQLRNYIEDAYIRMPLAVIVDPSADTLMKTKALWREALRINLNIKIVLVSLNASGIPAAYSFNNTRQFLAALNGIKEHDGGNSFLGIVQASELVPYDSAVFISTAVIPPHTELVQDAAITLLKKRIRLYLIWYGERSVSENETQEAVGGILGEVAIRSGGEILHIVGSENAQELEGSTLILVADAYLGAQEVEIPVDTTLSSLHIKIDAPMQTATLETPNGG